MTRFVPHAVRRRWKRRQHARRWRSLEVYAFQFAPALLWCHVRALNNAARIWRRHPEQPRKDLPPMDSTHHRYARALAAASALCAIAGVAVAAWTVFAYGLSYGGHLLPLVAFAYTALLLGWAAARERAAGRRLAAIRAWRAHARLGETPPPLDPCCPLFRASGTVHGADCTRDRPTDHATTGETHARSH